MNKARNEEEIVVLGGGIVGICCALSLQKSGRKVLLIERDIPGQATSYGNAGIISPWSIVPQAMPGIWKKIPRMLVGRNRAAGVSVRHAMFYLPWLIRFLQASDENRVTGISAAMHGLLADSVKLFQSHLRECGRQDLIRDSYYVHAVRDPANASLDSLANRLRLARGAEIIRLEKQNLWDLEPALSKDFKAATVIKGQARALDPAEICTALCDHFQRIGGRLKRAEVKETIWEKDTQYRLNTDASPIYSRQLVLSAGIWSAHILHRYGIKLPLAAERGYHITFKDANVTLNHSVMDVDNHLVASSMVPGLRITGFGEFSWVDQKPNQRFVHSLLRQAQTIFPGLQAESFSEWMGVRPSFPDSLPMIGEFKALPGLFAAFGHSHYGLMMAPKTGQLIANLANNQPVDVDLDSYSTERFN